jgi:hypothetical protein
MAVDQYRDLFEKYGKQFNVDPHLLAVVTRKESSGNRKAVGPDTDYGNAHGLMQIMPGNFKKMGITDPEDPEQNIRAGAQLLSEGLDKYGDVEGAARYYYGGSNEKLHGPKTRAYAKSIASRYSGDGQDQLAGGTSTPKDPLDDVLFGDGGHQAASGSNAAPTEDKLPGDADSVLFGDEVPSDQPAGTTPQGKKGADDSDLPIGETGHYASHGQLKAYETLVKANQWDGSAPDGSIKHPRFMTPDTTVDDVPDGDFYVMRGGPNDGKLLRKGGPEEGGFGTGLARGAADVLQSGANLAAGVVDPNGESDIRNALAANQLTYDAKHKGNLAAGAGRFTGQVAASLPLMAAGEALAAPALASAGGVGTFLAGRAGAAALPEGVSIGGRLLNAGVRGASLATKGAQEGATAAALVSSANDQPLADQIKTGAVVGGVLSPAASVVGSGVRRFVTGGATRDAASAADQAAIQARAANLPVPVPMTRGAVTGSPVQQMEESAMAKGVHGDHAADIMRAHEGRVTESLGANVDAIQQRIAGQPLTAGEGPRLAAEALNQRWDKAKSAVDAAYNAARASSGSAMLDGTATKALRDEVLGTLREGYGSGKSISNVMEAVEGIGSDGAPTVRDLMEARTQLSNLRAGAPSVETTAAGKAIKVFDGFINKAVADDLIVGDPQAIKAWKAAVKSRANMGRLFEGDDAIQALTERAQRGGATTNKIDPEDAANYLFNRSDLGMIGKKNLTRDVKRIRDTLGATSPEWAGVRSEVFQRLASAGRGPSTPGSPANFSGQKFAEAWGKMNAKSPELVRTMFTPDERQLIGDFADIAQRATTKVKGGDNPSGSGFVIMQGVNKALSNLGAASGAALGSVLGPGGAAGGATAGRVFDSFLRDVGAVVKARRAVSPIPAVRPGASDVPNRLLARPLTVGGAIAGQNKLTAPQPAPVP